MSSGASPSCKNKPPWCGQGLTLVELLVTLALMGLLAALAAPGFSVLAQRYKADLAASQMVAALNLARTEALRRGGGVAVQRLEDAACARPDSAQDWSCGWLVFADRDGDGLFNPPTRSGRATSDQLIQVFRVSDGTLVMRSLSQRSFAVNRWGQLGGVNLGFTFTPPNNRLDSTYQVCSATGGRIRKLPATVSCSGS
ncbi:MAG: GspH/FimT family protein [Curvibacter lanceolatus]|jgi:type IV fimbrial biogenesis protein FimT|uniref:GspH/FimT family protein n=1 Tax=Curvibacter lanceolatus TaxID=86182 RepID=UPI000381D261|nr:GspH/FimT family protein [Curvibacter lanceolatus]MBV5292598.1 GspH/FimT family protein [Curvibacter lanceolatus]